MEEKKRKERRRRPRPGKKGRLLRRRLEAYRASRQSPRRRRLPRAAVPSFFTLMNLFSGFLAIIQVYEGRFEYAAWLIVFAGFFDVLDGMMARLTNTTSLFGVELDSLSDVVSFGVAPAFLVYGFGLKQFNALGLVVSSLPAICGAVRLARFNVAFDEEGEKKDYFVGLPIPAQAVSIVALVLNFSETDLFSRIRVINNLSILIPIVVVLSFLMISNIRFDAIPRPSTRYVRAHPRKSLAFLIATVLLIVLQQVGFLIVMTGYIVINVGRAGYRLSRTVMSGDDAEAKPEEHEA